MDNHDTFREILSNKELIERISPKFAELTLDLKEVFEQSSNPMFVAALLFKLAEERERTNKILEQINDKYDKMMFELKTKGIESAEQTMQKPVFEVLPEQDQKIIRAAEAGNGLTAEAIRELVGYKGKNAASQRLNKLYREGYLKKIQSGKRVLYLPR